MLCNIFHSFTNALLCSDMEVIRSFMKSPHFPSTESPARATFLLNIIEKLKSASLAPLDFLKETRRRGLVEI